MQAKRRELSAPLIREAAAADLPAIRDLLVATWHDTYDAIYGRERVTDITGRWHSIGALRRDLERSQDLFLVATENGEIKGTAYASLAGDGVVQLDRIYVHPCVQGHGLGKALLSAVISAFPGAVRICLHVEPANFGAIRFYERHGFRLVGSGDDCCSQGDGIVHDIMERPLSSCPGAGT